MEDNDIKLFMARMDERWERVEEDLGKLKHVLLEGNGTPAMTVRMALMEQELARVKEERADSKVPRHVALGIWVSIVLGVGAILVGFIKS